MKSYDEIMGKLMSSAVQMEKFVVSEGEPTFITDKVRRMIDEISKLDEYMAYGAESELWNELVEHYESLVADE